MRRDMAIYVKHKAQRMENLIPETFYKLFRTDWMQSTFKSSKPMKPKIFMKNSIPKLLDQ